jgi:hypothetical protein
MTQSNGQMTSRQGRCSLTQRQGQFAKSHIIPEALTRPSTPGNPWFQYSGADPRAPVRRWTSWYDLRLVTTQGERILSDLDNAAVVELRKHKLVWSGWADASVLPAPIALIAGGPTGVRVVEGVDGRTLRLFFLSLLWRAAATSMHEFREIALPPNDLERLRVLVLTNDVGPPSFYPCQLTQLSTRGVVHNHAPLKETKYAPDIDGSGEPVVLPTFRFYFDGLIVHMHLGLPDQYSVETLGAILVGASERLALSTVTFEGSLQYESMRSTMTENGL